jgi:hypothetical protein
MPLSGTVSSNEKVTPNKAANNLDWGTEKVWASLRIDSPWQLGFVQDRSFLCLFAFNLHHLETIHLTA